MDGIAVVIDSDPEVLTNVARVMEEQAEDIKLFTFQPDEIDIIPPNTNVFVVDFDMGAISGSEIVRKIRELQKETIIIVWGVPLDPSGEEKISLFEAGANFIIDKYIENIATVVRTALKEVLRKQMFPQELRAARGF